MKNALYLLPFLLLGVSACSPSETTNESSTPSSSVSSDSASERETASSQSSQVVQSSSENSAMSDESSSEALPDSFEPQTYEVVEAYPDLVFEQPLFLTSIEGDGSTIFVVERTGQIVFFENDQDTQATDLLIDLSNQVDTSGSEQGLLGLAFHPDFAENGYFYVNYTNGEETVIERFTANPNNLLEVSPEEGTEILSYNQPYSNHNGGHMAFGPDGYLYIGSGDGGGSGDPQSNAQDLTSLLGKILRIDVNETNGEQLYGIPQDNPFAGNEEGYQEEIYAYGLRNPWRFSFDEERELLWAGDVGENRMEEIDLIENGENYGWNQMEGTLVFEPNPEIPMAELALPLWTYEHDVGQSVTGGYVYYGEEIPSLRQVYVYGDFVTGRIWGLWLNEAGEPENYELAGTDHIRLSSFGEDGSGELKIVDFNGKIFELNVAE